MKRKEESTVVRVFLDANVLIDLVLQRERYNSARILYRYIENGSVKAFISPSIVHIIAYWVKKSPQAPIVKDILIELCDKIEVVSVGHETIRAALTSEMRDIEDALQYYAALTHKMDLFISNDKHLKREGTEFLPVVAPGEFINSLQTQ